MRFLPEYALLRLRGPFIRMLIVMTSENARLAVLGAAIIFSFLVMASSLCAITYVPGEPDIDGNRRLIVGILIPLGGLLGASIVYLLQEGMESYLRSFVASTQSTVFRSASSTSCHGSPIREVTAEERQNIQCAVVISSSSSKSTIPTPQL